MCQTPTQKKEIVFLIAAVVKQRPRVVMDESEQTLPPVSADWKISSTKISSEIIKITG